jgi:hypothetical protein
MDKIVYVNMAMLPLKVRIALTEKAFLKYSAEVKLENPEPWIAEDKHAMVHYWTFGDGSKGAVMCIDIKRARKDIRKGDLLECQVISLFIHEAVHIWQRCKEIMGVELIDHEVEAYTIQWISQQFLHQYYKHVK